MQPHGSSSRHARPMGPLGRILWSGAGEQLRPEERQFAAALTPEERRSARRAVFHGRAAEGPAQARFAIVAARAARRQLVVGPWLSGLLVLLMGALFVGAALESRRDDPWVAAAFAVGGISFVLLGIATPLLYRRIPAGIEANLALLSPGDHERLDAIENVTPTAPKPPIFEFVFVAAGMTGIRQLIEDEPLGSSILGASIFALLLVGGPALWQTIRARRARHG